MSNYFICVGGTGSRIGEAFVYLAATGYFGEGDTQIWIVDKDTKCANGNTLHAAVAAYRCAQEACRWKDALCFNHNLSLHAWNFDEALKELSGSVTGSSPFKDLGSNSAEAAIMMNFLHDAESLDNSMSLGFYGRAQTGTALYKAIVQTRAFEQNPLFGAIQLDIDKGMQPNIYLAGSSFGATGASLLPNMAHSLREKFKEKVAISAVLMLPYFSYAQPPKGQKSLVQPSTHWEKAREALKYYGDKNRMSIRKLGTPVRSENVTFDSFYIAGAIPPRDINSTYAEGGEGQANKPHIAEMYAAMGAKHFFNLVRANEVEVGSVLPATYAYSLGTAGVDFNWDRIDPALKNPMLSFTRFAIAVLTFLHPLTHQSNAKLREDDTFKKAFGRDSVLGPARIVETEVVDAVNKAADFSKRYLTFIQQITEVGPDVNLFDYSFLVEIERGLDKYSPKPMRTLRDTELATQYKDQQRAEVYQLCQLKRIRQKPLTDLPASYKTTLSNDIITQIFKDMEPVKKANIAKNSYKSHTQGGMHTMFKSVYGYCCSLNP